MYAVRKMPGSLNGIESLNFASYWNAIKDKVNELRMLPTWATNHAMKLGMIVSRYKAEGRQDIVDSLQLEIRKVNDDITKAWKVKGYIDQYLPQWMAAAAQTSGGAPVVPTTSGPAPMAPPPTAYQEPSILQQATGWVGSWFGGGVSDYPAERVPYDRGLGVLPLVVAVVGLPALAYCVTTGMALYQDYVFKKDLTADMIAGKVSSGQIKDILTGARPSEPSIFANIAAQVGGNVGTVLALGAIGYLGFLYFISKRS